MNNHQASNGYVVRIGQRTLFKSDREAMPAILACRVASPILSVGAIFVFFTLSIFRSYPDTENDVVRWASTCFMVIAGILILTGILLLLVAGYMFLQVERDRRANPVGDLEGNFQPLTSQPAQPLPPGSYPGQGESKASD